VTLDNDLLWIRKFITTCDNFSEDLDFDILPGHIYQSNDQEEMLEHIINRLKKEGYNVSYKNKVTHKKVLTGKLSFPGLEYIMKVTTDPRKIIQIKIEAQSQGFDYAPDKKIVNKFGVFTVVNSMPASLMLASKLYTITERAKGRDFYDIVMLSSFTKADTSFLKFLFGKKGMEFSNPDDLKKMLLECLDEIDWNEKANEVSHFLMNSNDIKKVVHFKDWLIQTDVETLIEKS
jgi:predicted nucleotidyltransferase component of viral defense system